MDIINGIPVQHVLFCSSCFTRFV